MSDTIEIRGLRVLGTHGVLASEQERPQPFELDLDVVADLAEAARSDDLAETVDYGPLVAAARQVVETGRYRLLEALAVAVADAVLAEPRVESVAVGVRKLRPPLAADVATIGVRVVRRRDGLHSRDA
ncbi:MAG TPA: dihydroneopterin aldolase [Acidimicrobiales bacterium]|nr:dihydroneopterin aldolase [Acidimicrobiales bacterium]